MEQDSKIAKIRDIKDEVGELHPLLKDLLPKLPHVTKVDYTHGSSEMGADFIIERNDPTLDTKEYIGLIAKCGNIAQNHADVERQIRECAVERKIEGGRRTIYLNEIWVVSNGSISNRAKDKIHEEYRSKNIKFVWDERLVELITKHYPEYWESIDKHLAIYLSAVNRRAIELNKAQSLLDASIGDFYVEQEIQKIESNSKKKLFKTGSKPSTLISALQKERFIYIQAGMGYGKSRLLRQTAIECSSTKKVCSDGTLPILLSFRDLVEKYSNSLESLIEHLKNVEHIDSDQYSLLFFIDSVDEIRISPKEKSDAIASFVTQLMPHEKMKVIFASRPFDDPAANEKLDKCVSRYSLRGLTIPRLVTFLNEICSNTSATERIKRDFEKSDLFRSLPKTPISAILLGRVLKAEEKELPSTLPELYSKYLDLALGRWDIRNGRSVSEKEYETANILLRLIAQFMLDNDIAELSYGDAKSIIDNYLSKRQTGQSTEQIFSYILSCSEVISADDVQNKIIFKHRTFMEFMYAENLFISHGKNAVLEHPFDIFWSAVNYFYLGRLKDCPEQLKNIFGRIPQQEHEKLGKLFQGGAYLLAAYQSPYSEVTDCVHKLILEAADFYSDVCENPKGSVLGMFSEVQLLATLTALMRNAFEYEYFDKALADVETDILLSVDSDQRKALAAFFIAAIRAALGCKNAFDALITDHISTLPAAVKLGISHAADNAKITSAALKKYEKHLNRSKISSTALIKNLYDTPLIERKDASSGTS